MPASSPRPCARCPSTARIEATFENPSGGPPIVLTKDVTPGRKVYSFTTDALTGIKANKNYNITVRLKSADGKTIETIERQSTRTSTSRCSPTSR